MVSTLASQHEGSELQSMCSFLCVFPYVDGFPPKTCTIAVLQQVTVTMSRALHTVLTAHTLLFSVITLQLCLALRPIYRNADLQRLEYSTVFMNYLQVNAVSLWSRFMLQVQQSQASLITHKDTQLIKNSPRVHAQPSN